MSVQLASYYYKKIKLQEESERKRAGLEAKLKEDLDEDSLSAKAFKLFEEGRDL